MLLEYGDQKPIKLGSNRKSKRVGKTKNLFKNGTLKNRTR